MKLFAHIVPRVTVEDLSGLLNPSPPFLVWAKSALMSGRLDFVVELLIDLGQARDISDALALLNDLGTHGSAAEICSGDFHSSGTSQAERELCRLVGVVVGPAKSSPPHLQHGVVSHEVVAQLLSGELPFTFGGVQRVKRRPATQAPLLPFDDPAPGQLPFSFLAQDRLQYHLLDDIAECWQDIQARLRSAATASERYLCCYQEVRELGKLMRPIFDGYIDRLERYQGEWGGYLTMLTLMSWASVLASLRDAPHRVFFREIAVLNRDHRVYGWRADAIELYAVDGHALSDTQQHRLRSLSRKRYRSVGELWRVLRLDPLFTGKHLAFRIIDFKCAVGDFDGGDFFITPADCPQPAHTTQVENYLALATLDTALGSSTTPSEWSQDSSFEQGLLMYLLPAFEPVIHEFAVGSQEKEVIFAERFARALHGAQQKAIRRAVHNRLTRHLLNSVKGRPRSVGLVVPIQASLGFESPSPALSLRDVVDHYRVFVDSQEIIERTEYRGQELLLMHVDRLLAGLETGTVVSQNFDTERGGAIVCLMPNHRRADGSPERTPSMRVYLDRGGFHCFGCQARGGFAEGSIPQDIQLQLQSGVQGFRAFRKHNGGVWEGEIPKECVEILTLVQDLYASAFWNSPAHHYVWHRRGIDPDLAYSLGAGYATRGAIEQMLANGHSLEALRRWGLVSFVARQSGSSSLTPFLVRLGHKPEVFTQTNKKGQVLWPHVTMVERVTFALRLGTMQITNLYGRDLITRDSPDLAKRLAHRKLRRDVPVPLGGFHMSVLSQSCEEVVLTEGIFDALALIEMGYKSAVAIVGVDNYVVLEAVVRAGKPTAIALDRDKTGREITLRLQSKLEEMGLRAPTRDFTARFFEKSYVGLSECKDFSEWWKLHKPFALGSPYAYKAPY